MLSCQDLLDELNEYLDDTALAEVRREIERHLSECHTCRVLFDSSRKSLRIVTDSRAFDLPDGITTRILDRLRDADSPDAV